MSDSPSTEGINVITNFVCIIMIGFRSSGIFLFPMWKAITAELKKLIEEKAYGPEHVFDKEGTCLNRKKIFLCAVISKDQK